MASMFKGVTSFLEQVDQNYGERVANQNISIDESGGAVGWGEDDDDWNETPPNEREDRGEATTATTGGVGDGDAMAELGEFTPSPQSDQVTTQDDSIGASSAAQHDGSPRATLGATESTNDVAPAAATTQSESITTINASPVPKKTSSAFPTAPQQPKVSPSTTAATSSPAAATPSPQQASPSTANNAASKKQIESLLKQKREMEKTHEKAIAAADARYLKLEGDYDAVFQKLKTREVEVAKLTDDVEAEQRGGRQIKDEVEKLEVFLEEAQRKASIAQDAADEAEAQTTDLQQKLDSALREAKHARSQIERIELDEKKVRDEYDQYKQKATSLLAERDGEIEALRGTGSSSASNQMAQEILTLRSESERLAQELQTITQEKTTLATAAQETDATFQRTQNQLKQLQSEVRELATSKDEATKAATAAKQGHMEMKDLYEGERLAHTQTKTGLEALVSEKTAALRQAETDIASLQRQVKNKENGATGSSDGPAGRSPTGSAPSPPSVSSVDWERRSKELAELILEKQSALEAKRSECDQWKTRYEVSQQRLREVEMVSSSVHALQSGPRSRAIPIDSNGADDATGGSGAGGDFERSQFFGNLQRRGPWGEQVVNVARKIDTFSLRGGSYLRRNSVLRIALLIYVVALQLWVFFVVSINSSVPQATNDQLPK